MRTKVAAGTGESVINIGINLPANFAFPIYNLVLGVSPTLLGIAMMIPRIWDGFIDPIMGSISDNSTNRFGRRRPYMFIGGLLTAFAVLLLCMFPRNMHEVLGDGQMWGYSHGDLFYAGYLLVMSIIFYTFMTVFAVPYGALTMELTSDYGERTRVMSFRTFFTYLSGMLIGWLYAIAEWDIFKDPVTGAKDAVRGSYAVGVILVIVLLVASMLPTFLVKEPFVAEKRKQAKIPVLQGLKETLKVPAFLLIVSAYTIGFLGVIMVLGLGRYVGFFHVYGGDLGLGAVVQGYAHTCAVLTGILATIVINRLAHKVEKKLLLIGALSISFCGGLLSWWLYTPALPTSSWAVPFTGVVIRLHPLAFSYMMIWPGLAGLLILSSSMIADLCDFDELKTGRRREGMYWAVFNWIQKTAISIALLFSGVILDMTGFDATLAAQSERTIFLMRLNYMIVVCGGVGLAALLVACIPLNRQKMMVVQKELESRRGHLGGASDQNG
jgi:GPH family glycoside/pentoside/hexuronide:cation symporter